MRPSENRFSDGLLPAQEGKTDETDDRINDRRRIFSPQPECLRRFGEKHEYSGTNRSKISVESPSQTGYRLKIKINDAPGPLKFMGDMTIRYMARNCSYIINHFEGVSVEPTKRINTPIREIGRDEYETVFYFDAVQDEDYFGEGVCRWQPDGFGVSLKATGSPEETAFNVSDVMRNILEKKTLTNYYWKWAYPYSRKEDGTLYTDSVDFGIDSPEIYSAEQHKEMFTITVTLEEI